MTTVTDDNRQRMQQQPTQVFIASQLQHCRGKDLAVQWMDKHGNVAACMVLWCSSSSMNSSMKSSSSSKKCYQGLKFLHRPTKLLCYGVQLITAMQGPPWS